MSYGREPTQNIYGEPFRYGSYAQSVIEHKRRGLVMPDPTLFWNRPLTVGEQIEYCNPDWKIQEVHEPLVMHLGYPVCRCETTEMILQAIGSAGVVFLEAWETALAVHKL